jgi:hypothetical protein
MPETKRICAVVGCTTPIKDKLVSMKPTAWLCSKHYKEMRSGVVLQVEIPDNLASKYSTLKSLKTK